MVGKGQQQPHHILHQQEDGPGLVGEGGANEVSHCGGHGGGEGGWGEEEDGEKLDEEDDGTCDEED